MARRPVVLINKNLHGRSESFTRAAHGNFADKRRRITTFNKVPKSSRLCTCCGTLLQEGHDPHSHQKSFFVKLFNHTFWVRELYTIKLEISIP
jgi:hypothetical protein